jgi:replicative DNA helicase
MNQLPTHNLPPQAIEIEKAVLGAMLLEREAVATTLQRLKISEVFYLPEHKTVFEAISNLFNTGQAVDMFTVVQEIRRMGKGSAETAALTAGLTMHVNSAAHIESHCAILMEKFIRRMIIRVSNANLQAAYGDDKDTFQLLDKVQTEIFKLTNMLMQKQSVSMKTLMLQSFDEVATAMQKGNGITGLPSGIRALDNLTGGFQNSDLIILAARPGMGKTTFALNVIRHAAIAVDAAVAVFSLEMSAVQLTKKFIAIESGATTNQLVKGIITPAEMVTIQTKSQKLMDAGIHIDDTSGLTIGQLRAKCVQLKAQKNIQLVVVDYLQLLNGDKAGNREQEIGEISRGLKVIAKDLNVPVIALSQLSRAVEQRADKRPMLSDLRESGSIEQDADMVIFLYRPEYYGITQDEEGASTVGIGEAIVAKHRNGALDTIQFNANMKQSRITDLEELEALQPRHDYLYSVTGDKEFDL